MRISDWSSDVCSSDLRCQVWFRPLHLHRRMPLLVGWGLVALFIWLAENIGPFARAWTYPSQNDGWHMVGVEKLGSWYLLMIISFVLDRMVQRPNTPDTTPLIRSRTEQRRAGNEC